MNWMCPQWDPQDIDMDGEKNFQIKKVLYRVVKHKQGQRSVFYIYIWHKRIVNDKLRHWNGIQSQI